MSESRAGEILWPGDRVPVCCLLDDPAPCLNSIYFEKHEAGKVKEIPNSFAARFADVIERTGARGKFSVVPVPGGTGRIDQGVPDVPQRDIQEFIEIVRDRIQPTWSVGPEMLTHNQAYDLGSGGLLSEREDVWGDHQSEETLTPYISLALQILRNVGLDPTGVTSPWAFAIEVEDEYNVATETALREICGVSVGWYFLHGDYTSIPVPPRLMRCDRDSRTALVSLVSSSFHAPGQADFAWRTQFGEPANIDSELSADGKGGRLATLFPYREPVLFHTHWQSLFSNGSGTGLEAMEELFERINRAWGDRMRWTSARELAIYTTAKTATEMRWTADGRTVEMDAPFPCFEFTVKLPKPDGTTRLMFNEKPLQPIGDGEALREGTVRLEDNAATACFRLQSGDRLTWQ
jgi:hypothetical protein